MAENFFGITDTGRVRGNNEDAFIAQKTADKKFIIAAVIDGVGGYAGGEVAAAIARDTIAEKINASNKDFPSVLIEALWVANEKIIDERGKEKLHDGMACVSTVAVVDIKQNMFWYAHVGDTRLYLFRDGSLVKISSDHSFVGFLEDSGRLTEEAAMNHPKRNEINKALGFEPDIRHQQDYIETGSSPFLPGDTLLLCSDGLTDMVNRQDITSILVSPDSLKVKGYNLINMANHHGGHDNVTVVLVKNDKQGSQQEAILPPQEQKKKIAPEAPQEEPVKPHVDVVPSPVVAQAEPVPQAYVKSRSGLVALLSVLCLLFFATTIWFYRQSRKTLPAAAAALPVKDTDTVAKKATAGAQQQQLLQAMSAVKKDTVLLIDSVFKGAVTIDSSISISRDTLYIKGKGNITLKAGNGFKHAALLLTGSAKHVTFENITFDGFETAVATVNPIKLKNVKFVNCVLSVQMPFIPVASQLISGTITPPALKPDTLPKARKK